MRRFGLESHLNLQLHNVIFLIILPKLSFPRLSELLQFNATKMPFRFEHHLQIATHALFLNFQAQTTGTVQPTSSNYRTEAAIQQPSSKAHNYLLLRYPCIYIVEFRINKNVSPCGRLNTMI